MQKNAWIYSVTAAVLGALGLLLRWLQCQNIFEEETGLALKGSGFSVALVLALAVFLAGLWWLSGRMGMELSDAEPEKALAPGPKLVNAVLIVGALMALLGSGLLFFSAGGLFLRLAALLGLLAAAVLALYPYLPRWGGFGAGLSVLPVLFFAVWLVVYYKENSTNPVLWSYAMLILAIVGVLLATFRLCGYLFYRQKPRNALLACGAGTVLGLSVLMDRSAAANRLILTGWGVGLCALCWLLVYNLPSEE